MKIYLASHLGFSSELFSYRNKIRNFIERQSIEVLDPWDYSEQDKNLNIVFKINDYNERIHKLKNIAQIIGQNNEKMIRNSDLIIGVLDGTDIDSGVASEIGFAYGLGKTCYGIRTDFRNCGELDGVPVNLQLLHFIESSGGRIFRKIEDIRIVT